MVDMATARSRFWDFLKRPFSNRPHGACGTITTERGCSHTVATPKKEVAPIWSRPLAGGCVLRFAIATERGCSHTVATERGCSHTVATIHRMVASPHRGEKHEEVILPLSTKIRKGKKWVIGVTKEPGFGCTLFGCAVFL